MIRLYLTEYGGANEHETARRLAEYAFSDTFKRSAVLCHEPSGKPRFKDEDNIHISISHSDGLCAAVISDRKIGADIEHMTGNEERLIRLAKRFFTETEVSSIEKKPTESFYRIWCAKESYMKYTGEGFSRPMRSFSVLDSDLCFSHLSFKDYALCICSEESYTAEPLHVIL